MDRLPDQKCSIGPFVLDQRTQMLTVENEPVAVGRRAVGLLLVLVARCGEVVTKDELIVGAWGGQIVEESNLTSQIAALRRAFAAVPGGADWIETLARRGYRFRGPVTWSASPAAIPLAPTTAAPLFARTSAVRASELDGRPSIAVLPFRASSPDPIAQYLADGLVDDVISALSGLSELTVVSRGSSFRFRDTGADLQQVGRDLGVRYVVSGSLRRAGERIKVVSELAEAATGIVLASRAYESPEALMTDAQDSMVGEIVRALVPRVRNEELRRIRIKAPENRHAYDCVMQARELLYRLTRSSFDQVHALLSHSMALDPDYAASYTLMAEYFSLRVGQNWSTDLAADGEAVERFAQQAIERDPFDARALARYAHSRAFLKRDYPAAIATFERALDVSPNNADVWMWSACTYAYMGDGGEAVRRGELGLRLSPRDWFGFQFHSTLCIAHYVNGNAAEAVRCGLASAAENPRYVSNLRYLVAALVATGAIDRARGVAVELRALEPAWRVAPYIDRHPFSDPAMRALYGQRLLDAGLPP